MNNVPPEWIVFAGAAAAVGYVLYRVANPTTPKTKRLAASDKAERYVDMTMGIESHRGEPPFLYVDPSQLGDFHPATVDDVQDPAHRWH